MKLDLTKGFTLVELSIVLVILGLLVGGVLTGQSLIRASELRSVTTDYRKFQTAVNAFRDKYFSLPGPMANATAFWPTAINGDGSNEFGNYLGNGVKAWQHLSLAGMIEGKYSGTQVGTPVNSGVCVSGVECPPSKITGRVFLTITNSTGITPPYGLVRPNGFLFYDGTNIDGGAGMKPEDAWNIDTKIDDGQPGTGMLIGMGLGGFLNGDGWSNCATTAAGTAYTITRTDTPCRMYYLLK
jgi:prepilin-type N-terminal cleavage/methylation domain-containing protein